MKKILSLMVTLCMLMACMAVPMAVNADDTAVNYALATNGTTISYTRDDEYNPNILIDGSIETGDIWFRYGHSVTLTFKNYVQPSAINIYSNQYDIKYYDIQGSLDGENWFSLGVSENKSSDATDKIKLLAITYSDERPFVKYIKVTSSVEGTNPTFYELEVYGAEATGIPYLESLSTETGKWTTDFKQSTTAYKVQLDSLDSLPELTYETLMPDATVQQYTPASADNNYTATITVSHNEQTLTYTVQFILYNYALAANGTEISYSYDNSAPSDLIDGSTGSDSGELWFRIGHSVTLTFKNFVQPSRINIYANDRRDTSYSIQGSLDGEYWFDLNASEANIVDSTYLSVTYSATQPFVKYIKIGNIRTDGNPTVYEFEVYGNRAEETYTANCVVSDSKVIGNVLFLNKTEASEADKFYLMAVYVDGELYEVIPVDKSSVPVAAGAAASTDFAMTRTLPEEGTVTARLFVWSNPTTIVPVTTTPLDVL